MTHTVTGALPQDEINEAEWKNPENWSGPITGIYFSKRDSRVWVPKRRPAWGRTINVAHPTGAVWLLGFLIAPWVVVAALSLRTFVDASPTELREEGAFETVAPGFISALAEARSGTRRYRAPGAVAS